MPKQLLQLLSHRLRVNTVFHLILSPNWGGGSQIPIECSNVTLRPDLHDFLLTPDCFYTIWVCFHYHYTTPDYCQPTLDLLHGTARLGAAKCGVVSGYSRYSLNALQFSAKIKDCNANGQ